MTITRSDRKYFAGGVNPHDENVFGVLIETFSTLNLNIIKGHIVRTSRNDPDQNARMHMLIYNFACSAFLLSHLRHALQKWSDQLRNSGIAVTRLTQILEYYRNTGIPVKNTGIHVKTPILALIKKVIYSEDDLEKPRGPFSCSPKLVSFPCSLRRLIWVLCCCIGLSVPIFRFFKFLIRASFVCISDEERLYKIILFFYRWGFRHDFTWRTATSTWFLSARRGKCCFVTVHFLCILIIIMFSIYMYT